MGDGFCILKTEKGRNNDEKRSYVLQSLALLTMLTLSLAGCGSANSDEKASGQEDKKSVELLNVSYDPTRELYEEFNKDFIKMER